MESEEDDEMRYYYRTYDPMWGFDKLFNDVFSGWSESGRRFPPVDIYETEEAFVVEMELSGYGEDDVAMHVDKHVLTVSSEGVGKEKDRDYIVREVATPSFKRSFALPEGVDEAAIEARMADGVLTVTLPKKAEDRPRRIEVRIAK